MIHAVDIQNNSLKTINVLIVFALFFAMEFSYTNSVIEVFGYMGFTVSSVSILKKIFAYIIITLIIYIINFKLISVFAKIITQLIVIFLLFPAIIMFIHSNTDFQILAAHLLFFFTTFCFLKYVKFTFKVKSIEPSQKLSFLFFLTTLLIIPFFITYKLNISLSTFFLENIYETRATSAELSNPYLGYVYSWLARILIPMSIVFSFFYRSKVRLILFLLFLSYLFLVSAHKSILFGSIVIIFFYYIPKKYILLSMSSGVIALLLFGVILSYLYDNYFITSLITRRVFFVPALLDTYYFEFFNLKPLYWSGSFLSSFIDYPYNLDPPYLIGDYYFNKPNMSANNGLISDGYSNFGWIGIVFNIVVLSFIFSFFNSLRISHRFYGLFIAFFFSIVSSYLPAVLLTHGGILLIIVAQLFMKNTEQD
ncbi:oligosaccharide repeat unit polymerase [Flavobacteriaceae bacterium]|nr:oligosaccharide repeat unit polymerase [Flavobacteriaceae bacterium]